MTARDRIIIVVVLVAAALAGAWFAGLAPKRKEAADLQSQIDTAQQQLADAQQKAAAARKAKAGYDKDYAEVANLGKAVPKSDALPSLLYQLQSAAHGARIDFRSLKLSAAGGQGPAPTPAAKAASAANASNGNSSSGTSSPSGSSSSAPTAAPPAPATQAAAATLPPGASVGSAGFPTMPFSFVFNGSFFDMEQFLRDVQHFVRVDGPRVGVRGRLLSVDAFALSAGPAGFPAVKANVSATAYLLSADDAASSAATPAASSSAGGSSASGSGTAAAPPTAVVAGVTR